MPKRLMKTVRWISINSALCALLYLGLIKGIGGAQNLLIFAVWAMSLLSLFLWSKESAMNAAKSGDKATVPRWLDVTFDMAVLGCLAWYGFFWTASAYMIGVFSVAAHYIMVDEAKEKIAQEKAQ